jgi:hypothetical protein
MTLCILLLAVAVSTAQYVVEPPDTSSTTVSAVTNDQYQPDYSVVNTEPGYYTFDALTQDEHLIISTIPFYYKIGINTYYEQDAVVFTKPGFEFIAFPGTSDAILNGVPIRLAASMYGNGGPLYVPNRYVQPFFGAPASYDPATHSWFLGQYW